ncbi:hypothetical protein T440DRAFT_484740 [Plenodomus tracheiphilus IPT5]|uniref:Uncharacterized protein n=1 Tax=Plenodomus tracheiphilus IPT5 TaxID=1408161 RepID=A0A6A7BPN0_9PLEO|nr:hypothetical protein T440DRAFT_484740 [Plenodomus tracheiphilus IPT5]
MSWSFQLQSINHSFERIASWYREFMHRTELCFRELHERVTLLEQHQPTQGPTDEQVERVLRKILAERFSLPNAQTAEHSKDMNDNSAFVGDRRFLPYPRSILIDPASLVVEPDAVPSKAYVETFHMLENRLATFPCMGSPTSQEDIKDFKVDMSVHVSKSPDSV